MIDDIEIIRQYIHEPFDVQFVLHDRIKKMVFDRFAVTVERLRPLTLRFFQFYIHDIVIHSYHLTTYKLCNLFQFNVKYGAGSTK